MRGIEDTEQPNPRLENRRIRVSDILYALMEDNPNEQFEVWNIEQHKVFGAIQYYWQKNQSLRSGNKMKMNMRHRTWKRLMTLFELGMDLEIR